MKSFLSIAFLCIASAITAIATPVTVREVSVTPSEIVSISVTGFFSGDVYAGINNLLVDNLPTQGFCVDPFHYSLTGDQPYMTADLIDAPKDHQMTATQADQIRKLWAMAFPDIGMDPVKAAGLQIAIWEIVGGSDFHLTSGNDYGAQDLRDALSSYSGPSASLIALTGPGQDYVIAGPSVPDAGTTLLLMAIGIGALLWLQRVDSVRRYALASRRA